eukprot:5276383-Pyramimonas_sp.AAC.1
MVASNRATKNSSRCTPRDTLQQFPAAWSSTTCRCRRHRVHPGMENLHALLKPEGINTELTGALIGADGQPLSPHAFRVLLVVMVLQLREPRATLWPFPNPE